MATMEMRQLLFGQRLGSYDRSFQGTSQPGSLTCKSCPDNSRGSRAGSLHQMP